MKTFKLFVINLFVFLLLGNTGVLAQEKRPPLKHPTEAEIKKEVEKLGMSLHLSDEQKKKIVTLNLDHVAEVKMLIEKKMTPKAIIPDKIHSLRKKMDAQIMTLLNKEQQVGFQQYLQEKKPLYKS